MATVFFCSACGDTERVQSCTGRRRLNSSSLDNVYKLLESVIANKAAQNNTDLFSSLFPGLFVSGVPSILHTLKTRKLSRLHTKLADRTPFY